MRSLPTGRPQGGASLPTGPDLAELSDDELAEERDFLLRSLEDLDEELRAGDVDDSDYLALKDGYTARAAAVLRVLDARRTGRALGDVDAQPADALPHELDVDAGGAGASAGPATPAKPARPGRARAFVLGAGVAAIAVGAGLLVAHSAGQRLPGATVSGSAPNNRAQQLLAQAAADVQKADILGAVKSYQQVLSADPRNPEALANEGWLIAITGNSAHDRSLMDRGLASIRQAEQLDPSYASPHFFAGSILLTEGDAKGAVTEFEEYLADDSSSPQAALVRQDLQNAQALAAGRLPAGAKPAPATTSTTSG